MQNLALSCLAFVASATAAPAHETIIDHAHPRAHGVHGLLFGLDAPELIVFALMGAASAALWLAWRRK